MVSAKLILGKLKTTFQRYWKVAFCIILCILLFMCLYKIHVLQKDKEDLNTKHKQEVIIMQEEHTADINTLQNELNVNKQNAEEIKKELQEAQNNNKKPDVIYIETVTTSKDVVEKIEEKLEQGDTSLPPAALEETDKTVVTEQKGNSEVPVGIYKINTYRDWELGIGMGTHEDDFYIPVSLQRNYSKSHSIALEVHLDPNHRDINGAEVQYNMHF